MPVQTTLVRDTLTSAAEVLTPSERQVASILLTDYPVAGLQSITKLATQAGVSTPTVIRMARKLGFEGFPGLQSALREELSAQIKKPISKQDQWLGGDPGEHIIGRFADAVTSNLHHTLERMDKRVFDAAATILSDTKRAAYIVGGRITRSNADYLFNHLQIIRPGITLMSQSPNVWPQYLLDIGNTSVLVLFDIRRYEKDLARLAELANERGATIILFTDQWGSPIARHADLCFNTLVEAPSSWDSTIAMMVIIEALIADVQNRLGGRSRERIEELEGMFSATRIFRSHK